MRLTLIPNWPLAAKCCGRQRAAWHVLPDVKAVLLDIPAEDGAFGALYVPITSRPISWVIPTP